MMNIYRFNFLTWQHGESLFLIISYYMSKGPKKSVSLHTKIVLLLVIDHRDGFRNFSYF